MDRAMTVRLLVVGDDNVGKTTLVQALCGPSSNPIGKSTPGCAVSVRVSGDGHHIEEYYDVSGLPRYRHGRGLFFSARRYDAVLFVYDVTDMSTRSSISCNWIPEVMKYLGDVGAIESGGRMMDGEEGVHVTKLGVVNELRFLWRQLLFAHSRVSWGDAVKEGGRLVWRLLRLVMNEIGVWGDTTLDLEAERVFLETSLVPVALVGMKADLVEGGALGIEEEVGKSVTNVVCHANSVAHDATLHAFLKRVKDSVKRKVLTQSPVQSTLNKTGQVMLGFS